MGPSYSLTLSKVSRQHHPGALPATRAETPPITLTTTHCEGLDQFPIDPDLETASEKYSRQVAGQARRAILISSPTIFTRFTARKTRRCSHMPLRCRGVGYTERCL